MFKVLIVGAATVGRIHPMLWPIGSASEKASWASLAVRRRASALAHSRLHSLVALMFAAVQINGFLKFPKDFTFPQSWESHAASFRVGCLGMVS